MKLTTFPDAWARTMSVYELSGVNELADFIRGRGAPGEKGQGEWIKLAEFSGAPSPLMTGCLRWSGAVERVWGVEIDYDGAEPEVSVGEAIERLRRAGVGGVVYTTASHSEERPRWRALAPFSAGLAPGERDAWTGRLNGLLGGVAAGESYRLSQAYFVGGGRRHARVEAVEGAPLDRVGGSWPYVAASRRTGGAADGAEYDEESAVEAIVEGDHLHGPLLYLTGRGGWSAEQCVELMQRSKARENDPKYWASELRRIPGMIRGAAAKGLIGGSDPNETEGFEAPSHPTPKEPPRNNDESKGCVLLPLTDLEGSLRPVKWRIRDILVDGVLAVLFGPSSAAKSYMLIDWMLSISAGRSWRGHEVRRGPVVYIAGEGIETMPLRTRAWRKHHGVESSDCLFWGTRSRLRLVGEHADVWEELDAVAARNDGRLAVVAIDTVKSCTPTLELNDDVATGRFIDFCRRVQARYGCIVLAVLHAGWTESRRPKGSQEWVGHPDAVYGMIDPTMEAEQRAGPQRVLFCLKQRGAPEFKDIVNKFQVVEIGVVTNDEGEMEVVRESVLVEAAADENEQTLARRDNNVAILMEVMKDVEGGVIGHADAEEAFKRLKGATQGKRTGQMAFQRSLEACLNSGVIVKDEATGMLRLLS